MATSGSTDFTQTRDEIISRALRIIGRIQPGVTPASNELANASDTLNVYVKSLQNEGVRLWAVSQYVKTLTASEEVTGTDSNIYTCIRSHTSAAGNKPVTGAEWPFYWIKSGSTGGVWAGSTGYTSIVDFALPTGYIAIDKAYFRRDSYDYPLILLGMSEYAGLSDKAKTTTTVPTHLAFEPTITGGQLYIYPPPSDTTGILILHLVRTLEDFDAGANNADFPVRWLNVLTYGLASLLADEYSLDLQERSYIRARVAEEMQKVKGGDRSPTKGFIRGCFPVSNRGFRW